MEAFNPDGIGYVTPERSIVAVGASPDLDGEMGCE